MHRIFRGSGRRYLAASVALVAAFALAACGSSPSANASNTSGSSASNTSSSQTTGTTAPKSLIKVTEGVFASESWMPDFIAQAQGFFKKNGLTVTFIHPTDGVTATRLQIAGKIQIFPTDSAAAFAGIAKGFPLKIAGLMTPVGHFDIVARPGVSLPPSSAPLATKVKALEGLKIGVTGIGAATYNFPVRLLNQFKIPVSSVHFVAVGGNPTTAAGDLQAGTIDGYVSFGTAPLLEIMKLAPGSSDYIDFSKDDPSVFAKIPSLSLQLASTWASSHPQAIKDYLAAAAEALKWAKTNQSQAAVDMDKALFTGKFPSIATQVVQYALKNVYSKVQPGFVFPKTAFNIEKQFVVNVGLLTNTQANALSYTKDVLANARQ